jgi:hypothetical protein
MTWLQRRLWSGIVVGVVGVIGVAGVVGFGGGCATHHDNGDDDGSDGHTPPFDGALDYERTGGFVSTRTSMHVDAAGKMTWMKTDGSTTTTTLPAATVADLRAKVDQAEFLTLQPAYRCSCNDDIVHKIEVLIAGTPHMVVVDDSSDYPARLRPLVDTLSGLTHMARSQ